MQQACIVLNMGRRYWYFESCPSQQFDFAASLPGGLNLAESIKVSKKLSSKAKKESLKKTLKTFLMLLRYIFQNTSIWVQNFQRK